MAREYALVVMHDPCVYCGGKAEHLDHIQPVTRGGEGTWDNLAPACARCNQSKQTKSLLAFMLSRT